MAQGAKKKTQAPSAKKPSVKRQSAKASITRKGERAAHARDLDMPPPAPPPRQLAASPSSVTQCPPRNPPAGAMTKPPKRNLLKQKHKEELELTKAINADNEEHFAATASSTPGGKLSVVRGEGRAGERRL